MEESVAGRSDCSATRWSGMPPIRGCRRRERGRLVRALADREHLGPDGRLVRVAARRWDGGSARTVMAGSRRSFPSRGSSRCARRPGCWSSRSR